MYELSGNGLKQLRKDQRLTQTEMGSEIGVKRITVQKYESKNLLPSLHVIFRASNRFGVHFEVSPEIAADYLSDEQAQKNPPGGGS